MCCINSVGKEFRIPSVIHFFINVIINNEFGSPELIWCGRLERQRRNLRVVSTHTGEVSCL